MSYKQESDFFINFLCHGGFLTKIKKTALYETEFGKYYVAKSENMLSDLLNNGIKAHLILTSPPFPLNNKKKYGNLSGQDYLEWLSSL